MSADNPSRSADTPLAGAPCSLSTRSRSNTVAGERSLHENAAEILRQLMALAPGRYHEGQLRSMERRVKEWRTARAERLLGSMLSAEKATQTEEMTNPVATPIGGNN